jgi:hypothetical protein
MDWRRGYAGSFLSNTAAYALYSALKGEESHHDDVVYFFTDLETEAQKQ